MADQLAKLGPEQPFIGPEPDCGISIRISNKAVRKWTNRDHMKHYVSLSGLKEAKVLILDTSAIKQGNC
jgi:hypothetical protein